ncbi:MAG: hypothetical protein KF729_25525 [Sandaracinaceae bacterium]|nr:hypothetical protein [Sandaracinaceae bacterium]
MPRSVSLILCASWGAFACTGTGLDQGSGAGGPDPRAADFAPSTTACPIDPDAYLGGDPSLYECPDYWLCEDRADGKRCYTPGPDYPDGGEWECWDEGGVTICRGRDYPDDGGGGDWDCTREGEFVICRDDTPDYPDDGGGGPWDCYYADELRVCESGGDYPDGGGDGGRHGPCVDYYAAKFDLSAGGALVCEDIADGSGVFCLDGVARDTRDGCGMVSVSELGGRVTLRLPDHCTLIEAASKCATTCEDATVDASGGVVTFVPCSNGRGGAFGISHVEATWCCR